MDDNEALETESSAMKTAVRAADDASVSGTVEEEEEEEENSSHSNRGSSSRASGGSPSPPVEETVVIDSSDTEQEASDSATGNHRRHTEDEGTEGPHGNRESAPADDPWWVADAAGGGVQAAPLPRPLPGAPPGMTAAGLAGRTPAEVRRVLLDFFALKRVAESRFASAESVVLPAAAGGGASASAETAQEQSTREAQQSSEAQRVKEEEEKKLSETVRDRCARLVNVSAWQMSGPEIVADTAAADARLRDATENDVLLPASLVPESLYSTRRRQTAEAARAASDVTAADPSSPPPPPSPLSLRRHQIEGIRFLWGLLAEGPVGSVPSVGCILSHTMGLGKTAQVVIFLHLFFQRFPTRPGTASGGAAPRVLVAVPKSTLSSWAAEFRKWGAAFPPSQRLTPITTDAARTAADRDGVLRRWHARGGVLLLNYERFSLMAQYARQRTRSAAEQAQEAAAEAAAAARAAGADALMPEVLEETIPPLLGGGGDDGGGDPFVEMIVCDEAHRLKSARLQAVRALRSLHPLRRLLLTGTPLQNHLMEYWAMIDFALYKFFERRRFQQFFLQPIHGAAHQRASAEAVDAAKKKTFALVNEVRPFVLRMDSAPLRRELPPLHETVVVVALSQRQRELYLRFVDTVAGDEWSTQLPVSLGEGTGQAGSATGGNLLASVSFAGKIATHPLLLYRAGESSIAAGGGNSADGAAPAVTAYQSTGLSALCVPPEGLGNYRLRLEDSGKMTAALHIIAAAMRANEKVLVFSLSTQILDLCEQLFEAANTERRERLAARRRRSSSSGAAPAAADGSAAEEAVDDAGGDDADADADDGNHTEENGTEASPFPPLRLPRPIRYIRLDGSSSHQQRTQALRSFNQTNGSNGGGGGGCGAPGPEVFLLSTKAGGVGVTITAATRVIILDTGFNPADDQQAIGRAYRYGQTRPVFVYRLLCEHTLEQSLFFKKLAKEWVFQTVVEESLTKRNSLSGITLHEMVGTLRRDAAAIRATAGAGQAAAVGLAPRGPREQRRAAATAALAAEDAVLAAVAPLVRRAERYSAFLEKDADEAFGLEEELYYQQYRRLDHFAVDAGESDAAAQAAAARQTRQRRRRYMSGLQDVLREIDRLAAAHTDRSSGLPRTLSQRPVFDARAIAAADGSEDDEAEFLLPGETRADAGGGGGAVFDREAWARREGGGAGGGSAAAAAAASSSRKRRRAGGGGVGGSARHMPGRWAQRARVVVNARVSDPSVYAAYAPGRTAGNAIEVESDGESGGRQQQQQQQHRALQHVPAHQNTSNSYGNVAPTGNSNNLNDSGSDSVMIVED